MTVSRAYIQLLPVKIMAEIEKKRLSKKAQIIVISCCAVGGILIGGGAGFLIGHFGKPPTVELGDINIDDIDDKPVEGEKSILERYEECKSEGKDPMQVFQLHEIANIASSKLSIQENYVAWGYGQVLTAVNLDILNCSAKNGDKYIEESLSKSQPGAIMNVVVCQRDYQTGTTSDSPVKSYVGDIKDTIYNPTYENAKEKDYTVSEYESVFGKPVSMPSSYVVSSKTVLTDTVTQTDPQTGAVKSGLSKITKTDYGYELYLDLHTTYSVARYYKRMINLSGSNVSLFNYIHLTYKLDNDLNFISTHVEESYVAGMGNIKASVDGKLDTYFFTSEKFEIPDINQNINYPKKGESHA